MSAPDTNVEKQEKRHAGPLIGIAAAVVFGLILVTAYTTLMVQPVEDGEPEAAATAAD
ncbi:MAG: hypothetical protein AAF919_18705 [Pseudomonadota bacterium]